MTRYLAECRKCGLQEPLSDKYLAARFSYFLLWLKGMQEIECGGNRCTMKFMDVSK